MRELLINEQTAGGRLDKMIFRYLDKASPGFVYKMLRKKNITLNDKKASGKESLIPGDSIKLYLAEETISRFRSSSSEKRKKTPAMEQISQIRSMIVYEDEHVLAFNKPSGMLSQSTSNSGICLNDLLISYLGKNDVFTPGISNRLDRNTTGLVLAGKDPASVRELNRAIRDRDITKLYLCIVKGQVEKDRLVEGYLSKDPETNQSFISKDPVPGSSFIKTAYHVIAENKKVSLLEVDLITGKSHQIRAHLSSEGHPVIGDPKYGDLSLNAEYRENYRLQSQLLHAGTIRFGSVQGILSYLEGKLVTAPLPKIFEMIMKGEDLCLHGDQED